MEELLNPELDDTPPSGESTASSPAVLFLLEEYKVYKAFILETQKRVTTYTIASIAVATTLLSGVSNFIFTRDESDIWLLPYIALFPALFLLITMRLMTSHRAAIGGAAAYIVVGIEEALGVSGSESVLREARRLRVMKEANDPIADAFHLLIIASFIVFAFGIGKIEPPAKSIWFYAHLLAFAPIYLYFVRSARQFRNAIPPAVEANIAALSQAIQSIKASKARQHQERRP